MRIADILNSKPVEREIEIQGWLKTRRDAKGISFLEINDGSCLANLQVIASEDLENYAAEIRKLSTGCSLRAIGRLECTSGTRDAGAREPCEAGVA